MTPKKKTRTSSSSIDPVTAYAKGVCEGRIIAGPHVRGACARHLRDLRDGPKRGLAWRPEAAERFFAYCRQILRLNGGDFEGKPFELEPAQQFIAGSIFGWLTADGSRRFRVCYIEMGKGNGKSPLAAAIGLYCLTADGESRAEVYAAATKKDQAAILFRDAVAMVDQSPKLGTKITRSGGKGKEWNLAYLKTGSFFRPISSDSAQSGPRPHCALLDEVHEHKTGLMVEMMRAGTKGRRQALIVLITNSGVDKKSVCWQYHEQGIAVAGGMAQNDAMFAYVCALDEGDDPLKDRSCWIKANPLKGVSITDKYLEEQVREAELMPGKESTVRRLNFCQWVEAHNPWIGGPVWMAAADPNFDEDRLRGRRCFGGLDLSSTTDLTAFTLLFEPSEDDPHWRQKAWFWLPEAGITDKARKDKVDYLAWRAAGWLETTPGSAVNKMHVMQRVVAACSMYEVVSIGFDRWRIEDLMQMLDDAGATVPLVPFGQGFKDMAPAVDEYERLLISGELKHDGNPVMTWNAASAVVSQDDAGNRKPAKQKATGRIDGIVAGVMAAGQALASKGEPTQKFQMLFL